MEDGSGAELRAVRLDVPVALHGWLRVEAAKADVSMSAYVRRLIEADYREKTAKPGRAKS
jgi:hypothetical protein